jgi:hypothetical protein
LSDSQRSENTINTHKYNIIYCSSSRSYYNLGSCISYIERGLKPKLRLEDKSEFEEAISLNNQDILFALKENAIHRCSKPEDPCMESNPHRFRLFTDNPHQHRRKNEAVPHLHTGKTTGAKLERLRSARLIQGDQKITTRHAQTLNNTNIS